ncbi:Arf GTPase activating protein [Penicillium samsonianum]|uniref:Arf GTPase activating protein n=1 Tax=Penicillium samsonianum TaxID=1882272 RepID=UPI002546DDF4|nr:Arf GTPase activating protein [Penicillium samsonianum]KAJ6138151.1 Arf GTPase activating protein [Penicillium samsonianum]
MAPGISKRQQARNEKTLAELIRTVPGNDRCADCDALTPGWASWNMGIFLCMRCAALHRKLGTHISKVKSLSMDTWTSEQVDNMKSHGNMLMNKMNNPRGIKPPIPADIDEADACMERFIRQKYQHRSLENGKPKPPSREDSSYSNTRAMSPVEPRRNDYNISPEGSPPPLPPKTGRFFKFGLRSSSSTSNLRRFGGKPKVTSPTSDDGAWSPPLPSRKTTGLGAPVADVTTASFESKMAALQQMGFTNDRRNEMVLKGLHEDLDRAVETLVRLGEGGNPAARSRTPAGTSSAASARVVIPKPETSKNPFPVTTDNTFPEVSNNPFDRAVSNPVAQSQTQQPQTASYNPFDQMNSKPASTQPLESSFQGLQVSQPLFPHSTGGYPNQTSSMQHSVYQQSYTPPVTSTFSQSPYVTSPQPMDNSYNPFDQAPPQPQGGLGQTYPNPNAPQTNPFFNTAQQNQPMQPQQQQTTPLVTQPGGFEPPRHANTMPVMSSASPFGPTASFQVQQQQQQQQQQQPQPQHQPSNGLGAYNPFQQGLAPNTAQNAGGYSNQFQSHLQPQQAQQLMPQPTGMDKNSILSLYNMATSATSANSTIPATSTTSATSAVPAATDPTPTMNPYSQPSNPYTSMPQTQQATNFQPQNQSQPQPQQNFQPQQPTANAQPATSNNPFFGTAPTGSGSGLAAQAGINPYQQQSSGLGIGGMNGQPGVGTSPGTTPATGTNNSPFSGMSSPPFAGANSSPFAGGKSPFSGPPPTNSAFPRTHMSQPSVDVSGLQNGRHSPDAFASLSARYG